MHPGPINRGVEIDSEVADGPQSVILDQVTNGLAVRMAVLYLCGGISNAMNTFIRNGRIIDPANKRDEIADLLIVDGRIRFPLCNSQVCRSRNPMRLMPPVSSSPRA